MPESEPQKRGAIYAGEENGRSGPRPKLEEMIRQAAKRPRPFDMVMVYSPRVLGSPEDVKSTIARFEEHGVEVRFAKDQEPEEDPGRMPRPPPIPETTGSWDTSTSCACCTAWT